MAEPPEDQEPDNSSGDQSGETQGESEEGADDLVEDGSEEAAESVAPEGVQEALENAPESVQQFMGMFAGPAHAQIYDEIEPEHIDKVLDNSEKESKRQFRYAESNKWYNAFYLTLLLACGIGLLVFLIVYLPHDSALLDDLIGRGLAFLGGLGSAFAFMQIRQ